MQIGLSLLIFTFLLVLPPALWLCIKNRFLLIPIKFSAEQLLFGYVKAVSAISQCRHYSLCFRHKMHFFQIPYTIIVSSEIDCFRLHRIELVPQPQFFRHTYRITFPGLQFFSRLVPCSVLVLRPQENGLSHPY